MVIWLKPAKRLKKARAQNSEEVLARLKEYLNGDFKEPVRILGRFWKDQQDAITYQELRQAVITGDLNEETYRLWSQDYSALVTKCLKPVWEEAIRAGSMSQPIVQGLSFEFNMQTPGIMNWIRDKGAAFVTVASAEQKSAIQALLAKKMVEGHTVDELAKFIRPCIGLTKPQAEANRRYYDSVVAALKENHPRMKPETIERKAREAAAKYAEKQHRQRALTIARTESAFAYNWGADEGIRQAQAHGLMGKVVKRWCTSGDDGVCDICAALEGEEIGMDAGFGIKGKELFEGHHMLPPAHPNCACAIEYIEIEPLGVVDSPQVELPAMQGFSGENSFREYTTKEIETMAEEMDETVSRHIAIPGKWSGRVVVDDERGKTGKLWSCDILTTHMTAPHLILHEQVHARSISHYGEETYLQYGNIEEASVQFMAQEISSMENIEIIESQYDEMANALRQIGQRMGLYRADYDFAKFMIEMPVVQRLDWISKKLYDILGKDINVTIEEYQKYSDLLDMLY